MHARSLLVIAAIAGSAAPGLAQCNYTVSNVPDFDQKREAVGGTPGLPGSGGMYCVPTSVTNWFAYFANHGIPQPGGLNGPRIWQSNTNYNLVTTNLQAMGALMSTSASNGTTGNNGTWGAYFYSLGFAQGKVIVLHYWAGDGTTISPTLMRVAHELGGFVAGCYGYYNQDSIAQFTRDGGHCITVIGQANACGSGTPTIRYRDPASDGYNSTQSQFATHEAALTPTPALFRGAGGGSYSFDVRYRVEFGTTPKFLDSCYVLLPTVALTSHPLLPNSFQVIRPLLLQGSSQPTLQNITLPTGLGTVRGMVMHPHNLNHYYITGPAAVGGPSRLSRIDPITGASTPLLTGTDFRFMTSNRFGELYLCDGSVLKLYKMNDPDPPVMVAQLTLPSIPRALAYDDSTDTVAVITPPGAIPSGLARYNRNLSPGAASALLPASVNPQGNLSLAFSNGGWVFLCGDGTNFIYRMSQTGTTLTPMSGIGLPAGDNPTGLNVDDDDHVLFATDGVLREYELDANNRYVPSPGSLYAGRGSGPHVFLLRSRSNHIPALHEGPGFRNLADPEIAPGVPDCYANCDGSTTPPILNVNDFICYQALFASGRIEANCDASTAPPVLNVNDFICFQSRFAQGCP